jgi:amino-acid N-acetyltransferase
LSRSRLRNPRPMKPTDLRGILQYVPAFRDRVFVIALDGAIVGDENFANLLLDIAVLRSLNIKVLLVHGAGMAIQEAARQRNITPSDLEGSGVTDEITLDLAVSAGNRLTHEILKGLAAHDIRAVCSNCITSSPLGIIKGVDHLHTGKVERVDSEFLLSLLGEGCVPIIPPLGTDGAGTTHRINSDAVAVAVARALKATKLIFATPHNGLLLADGSIIRQMDVGDLEIAIRAGKLDPDHSSKAQHAAHACAGGVPRVHVINGLVDEGLLAEVFSNEGIGTLIYANDYREIRSAKKSDIRTLRRITRHAVESDELLRRTRADMELEYQDYFIYEIDHNPVGCVALHEYAGSDTAELAFLYVAASHENQGIGRKLMGFVEDTAKDRGVKQLIALSTQAYTFLTNKGGFTEGSRDSLPAVRRESYEQNGRNSKVLVKAIS